MKERRRRRILFACRILGAGVLLLLPPGGGVSADTPADKIEWTFTPHNRPSTAAALPLRRNFPVQLILDDGSPEGDFGVGAATAQQFLWFNQFERPTILNFNLDEIWVLFSPGPNMAVGEEIQLVVYVDPDSDPTNGADLLASFDETIQVLDGATFSVYPMNPPVPIRTSGDILIGVVSRFVESGVTGPTEPAALDTSLSQGRSWVAIWSGDPPPEPALPNALFIDRVDVFLPGNWMIRGFGSEPSITEIPTLSWVGLAVLAALLGAGGFLLLRQGGRSPAQPVSPE